jgi:phosphatidylserine/phosphatidylglycerophosphate/cardiolipin synthase-like enzyme
MATRGIVGRLPAVLDVRTLEEDAQTAESIGEALIAWIAPARSSLDLALYDVRLPGPVGDAVAEALRAALSRGVRVRIAFNDDTPGPDERPFEPPPPSTEPHVLEALGAELKPIPGWRDLMHHKYVIRDGAAVWTGSMNWTLDSWTRQENVIATVESTAVAAAFAHDFGQLWETGHVGVSGNFDTAPDGGVRPWFCPGRGRELSHRVAKRIGAARERVRIATPLVTAGPILGALNEVIAEGRVDIAGVCDATQVREVFRQWAQNPHSRWKGPLLANALPVFTGKRSTPWARGTVHDFMHAKVTVADDVVLLGSFNLSRSGEMNAENVLEIADAALADRLAAWIDGLRTRYPEPVDVPR